LGIFSRSSDSSGNTSGNNNSQRGIRASAPRATNPTGLPSNSAFLKPQPQLGPGYAPAQAAPYSTLRPLTAAATQIALNDRGEADRFRNRRLASSSSWQAEAWEYYDAIGEIKYAFNLVASVVSRIRLYAAVVEDPAEAPQSVRLAENVPRDLASAAERALARLDSAYGGQAGLLRDCALNLSVTGECYLVQSPDRVGSGIAESWDIRSTDELSIDSKGNYIITARREYSQGNSTTTANNRNILRLAPNAFVGRIWRAHPRYSDEADSSLKGMLDLCAELLLLNRTFRATARSRLNAGALYLPDGLSVAATPDPNYPYEDEDGLYSDPTPEELQDEFEDQLIDAMTTPIRDEDSASAVVPLIIRGPAELGDKIKQFKFERSFDPALAERSDRVLDRILQGIDVPKDVVTGLANVKYSNALQIDETLYKTHIEPLMLLIADAITVVYLRPYLIANGYNPSDVERLVIWYDPSAVATRNDRAMDADSGFDKMAVSFDTWRRTHGFTDADAPSPTELGLRLLIEKGAITPELTEAMLAAVAPEVMEAARRAQQAGSSAPIPGDVAQMLQGQPAAPEEAPAAPETPEAAPAAPENAPAQGEAPPIQLAEPTTNPQP
jgi:hypothetical protein